ncbi:MAG: helix-turn-helix transcriptional regulator [Clostridiales bacterium]|nr:helix-turn-helix transcriptional regulator [Clostridiales bacterium]
MKEYTFNEYLDKKLKDPCFKEEWDALEPEFAVVQALIDARLETGLTQSELSKITGIAQGDISKLERGNGNPSIKTLKRLAAGMGKTLKIEFVDADLKDRAKI